MRGGGVTGSGVVLGEDFLVQMKSSGTLETQEGMKTLVTSLKRCCEGMKKLVRSLER